MMKCFTASIKTNKMTEKNEFIENLKKRTKKFAVYYLSISSLKH